MLQLTPRQVSAWWLGVALSLAPDYLPPPRLLGPPQESENVHQPLRSRASICDLPTALLLTVVPHLPRLVDRVRCALVCKQWSTLLREPAFWTQLSFDGGREEWVFDHDIESCFRRGAGRVASLDVTAAPCEYVSLETITDEEYERVEKEEKEGRPASEVPIPLLPFLATQGLTARLHTLIAGEKLTLNTANDARQLVAACPALTSGALTVEARWTEAAALLRLLPAGFSVSLTLVQAKNARNEPGILVPYASAVAESLSCHCCVDSFTFTTYSSNLSRDDDDDDDDALPVDIDAMFSQYWDAQLPTSDSRAAAAALGAILAHPSHGPCTVSTAGGLGGAEPRPVSLPHLPQAAVAAAHAEAVRLVHPRHG